MQPPIQPYDYTHRSGIDEISWERFALLSARLVERLAPSGIQAVVGVARAGLFPATRVATALRVDLHPVRLTRRSADQVVSAHPQWKQDVPAEVRGKVIAVVDEIADTGESLALVRARVLSLGAERVITATLVSHSWANPQPDIVALQTDALVIFPWDHPVYIDGNWRIHPELADAIRDQQAARGDDAG